MRINLEIDESLSLRGESTVSSGTTLLQKNGDGLLRSSGPGRHRTVFQTQGRTGLMHISDGVLSAASALPRRVAAVIVTGVSLRKTSTADVPRVAVMTAAFLWPR